MQRELDAAALQFGDHRHHRRDADAAGQQQMPCRTLGEREIVARQCRLDGVADPDLVMQSARAVALAQHPHEAVDADQGPEHLDDDRGIVPLEDQRDEDQHGADQVEERKTPVFGRQPALLIREIRRDKDRRTGKPDDVVWLDIAPHRRLPAAAANPVENLFGRASAARHNREDTRRGKGGAAAMAGGLRSVLSIMAGLGMAAALAAPARAQAVNMGTLTCSVASGWGLILGSARALGCNFTAYCGRAAAYL